VNLPDPLGLLGLVQKTVLVKVVYGVCVRSVQLRAWQLAVEAMTLPEINLTGLEIVLFLLLA
jgi:hypothetical protein